MTDSIYLSRAFVEFGPFAAKEILDFQKRGLLQPSDYLRADGSDIWLHVDEFLASISAPTPAAKPAAKKAPAKPKEKAAPAAKKKSAA